MGVIHSTHNTEGNGGVGFQWLGTRIRVNQQGIIQLGEGHTTTRGRGYNNQGLSNTRTSLQSSPTSLQQNNTMGKAGINNTHNNNNNLGLFVCLGMFLSHNMPGKSLGSGGGWAMVGVGLGLGSVGQATLGMGNTNKKKGVGGPIHIVQ